MNKNIFFGIIAILVVVVLAASIGLMFGNKTIVNTVEKIVGGTNPDFQTNWFRFGGVEHFAGSQSMTTATTTICAIQGPSSTSTLIFGSASFVYASSTGAVIAQMAKAATAFATTTSLGLSTIASGASGTLLATTTPTGPLDPSQVFGPNEWFVVGLQGTTVGTDNDASGTCKAEWIIN